MTTPTAAVSPVSPVSQPSARPMPSQDDRVLAACAHLSFLVGFWLVAPIAIYVVKRKESHFVSFAALQAALVQVLFGGASVAGFVFFLVFGAAAGMSGRSELGIVAAILPLLVILVSAFGMLLVHAYGAWCGWRGVEVTIPVAGQIARAIQNADEGALKA